MFENGFQSKTTRQKKISKIDGKKINENILYTYIDEYHVDRGKSNLNSLSNKNVSLSIYPSATDSFHNSLEIISFRINQLIALQKRK